MTLQTITPSRTAGQGENGIEHDVEEDPEEQDLKGGGDEEEIRSNSAIVDNAVMYR